MIDELPDDHVTINQAAKLVSVNPSTIWRWIQTRKLSSWRLVGRRRVSRAEVLALVRPCSTAAQAARSTTKNAPGTDKVLRAAGLL